MSPQYQTIFRHLLSDKLSLRDYMDAKYPDFASVNRRLFLLEKAALPSMPDHYHRIKKEHDLASCSENKSTPLLANHILNSLTFLAGKHLLLEEHKEGGEKKILVRVQATEMNYWQELITWIPPLILQIAKIHQEYPLWKEATPQDHLHYFKTRILPNLRYTALPTAKVLQIEHFMLSQKGFHELHLHLNGTTETDVAWQKFLATPNLIYENIERELSREEFAREQFEEIMTSFNSAKDIRTMLFCARLLRSYFFWYIYDSSEYSKQESDLSRKNLLWLILNEEEDNTSGLPFSSSDTHPFFTLLPKEFQTEEYAMATEGLMHSIIMTYLENTHSETFASMYHFYLLILGTIHQLIVQQTKQVGFEQFQKITKNGLRNHIEQKSYYDRFTQLLGNNYKKQQFRFLEGRFAPKQSDGEMQEIVGNIVDSWKKFENKFSLQGKVHLSLIAHFIKERDRSKCGIRHEALRRDLQNKADVLSFFCNNNIELGQFIRGIDAAASEFDTPPEVFSPIFRALRKKGIKHFTYHAGEDFYHLLGGLRSIYEAIEFCDLQAGDRIGHAVAAGIDPQIWKNNIGETFYMRQGEYLDDLVFAYYLLLETSPQQLNKIRLQIKHRINDLSEKVYGRSFSLNSLVIAWKLRKEDPLSPNSSYAKYLNSLSDSLDIQLEIINNLPPSISTKLNTIIQENAWKSENDPNYLLWKYHNDRQEYNKVIEVQTTEIFTLEQLEYLQLEILHHMCKKEIVIETLPTSNVRIGRHNNFNTYHLKRWIQWRKEGKPIPPIVLGTDDPGIFATNLYNEYANVYCNLVENKVGSLEAMEFIHEIERSSSIYRFE